MRTLLIAALTLSALAASASAQETKAMQCFTPKDISGSRVVNDSTINFGVRGDIYRADLNGPCGGLSSSLRGYSLTLRSSNQICGASDLRISVNDIGGGNCIARTLRKLTPQEAAALPQKERP